MNGRRERRKRPGAGHKDQRTRGERRRKARRSRSTERGAVWRARGKRSRILGKDRMTDKDRDRTEKPKAGERRQR